MEAMVDQHEQLADTTQAPVQQPVLLPTQQLQQLMNAIHNRFQARSNTITATSEQQQPLQGPTAPITAPQLQRSQQQQQMKPTTLERSTSAQKENSILQLNVPAIAPHKGPISTAEPQHQPTPSMNNGKMHQQPQVQCSAVTNKQSSRVSQQPSIEIMHQPTPWINNQTHQQPPVQQTAITNKKRNRVSQQPSVEIMPQNQQSVMHQPTAVSPTELNKRQERELEEVKGKLMNKMKSTKTSAKTTSTKNPKKHRSADNDYQYYRHHHQKEKGYNR